MDQTWNLKPEEWSKVLTQNSEPQRVAEQLKNGQILPWVYNLIEFAKDAQSTLDLGSGRGENSAALALRGKKTTLLDWSQDNLNFSWNLYHALGLQGDFHRADMTQGLSFDDRVFDFVFSCGVFEYFSDEQIVLILKEAFRVAKKRVMIMVPNAWSIPYRFGMWHMKKTNNWPWGGERPFTTLRPYFAACGMRRITEFSAGAKHSLDFLTMPGGSFAQKVLKTVLHLHDHSRPSWLRQGYLLMTIGDKE